MDTNNEHIRYTNVHVYRDGETTDREYIYSPPAWKVCYECNGGGERTEEGIPNGRITNKGIDNRCPECNGTGRIPIYYTPEEWKEEGGVLSDDTPVWIADEEGYYGWELEEFCVSTERDIVIIALPGQDRPPEGWRPE